MKLKGLKLDPKKAYYRQLFFFLMTVFALSFLGVLLFTGGYSIRGLLASDRYGSFMEFFNKLILSGGDSYRSGSVTAPFALLFYRCLLLFVPGSVIDRYVPSRVSSAYPAEVKIYQEFNYPFILFSVIAIFLLFFALKALKKGSGCERFAFIFFIFLSSPMLFGFERGSDVVITVALCALFIGGKDSEKKIVRNLSLAALGVAGALAVYPLLFCILLLKKKRFIDAGKVLAVFVVLTVPALFIVGGGFAGAAKYIANIIAVWKENSLLLTGQLNFSKCLINLFAGTSASNGLLFAAGNIFACVIGVLALAAAFLAKKEWQTAALVCGLIAGLAPLCETHLLAFFAIPLAMFLDAEDANAPASYVTLILLTLTQALVVSPDAAVHGYTRMFVTRLTGYGTLVLVVLVAATAAADFAKGLYRARKGDAAEGIGGKAQ